VFVFQAHGLARRQPAELSNLSMHRQAFPDFLFMGRDAFLCRAQEINFAAVTEGNPSTRIRQMLSPFLTDVQINIKSFSDFHIVLRLPGISCV
jgi:hypothetical protein